MKNILVTGGAGYIGSITAWELKKAGFNPIIFDSMEKGHEQAIKGLELVKGNTQDKETLIEVLKTKDIAGVIHFAAYIEMGESMQDPYKYFLNNYLGSLQLLEALKESGVKKIVFSSTAGVYGDAGNGSIKEDSLKKPSNPYGQSKLMTEESLSWYQKIHNIKHVVLRYFNAAGADLEAKRGESHNPESHLIPNLIYSILKNKEFSLYGTDYDTPDGTCVRDYIHVLDLAQYHILALKHLFEDKKSLILNAGTGKGYSNKQVIEAVELESKIKARVKIGPRRPGDAAVLVANNEKIIKLFNYKPKHSDLNTIVKTAWNWHQNQHY